MISVSYFGTKSPPNGDALGESKPLWSKTWDRSPFDKGTIVDWKTGTIRSPLFDPDTPDDQSTEPFVFPQWNVTAEPQENGDIHLVVASGLVVWQSFSDEKKLVADVIDCIGVDLGIQKKSGVIVWACTDSLTSGNILFIEGEVTPEEEWLAWIPLASVVVDEEAGYIITQEHGEAIIVADMRYTEVLASEDPERMATIKMPDGSQKVISATVEAMLEGSSMQYVVGLDMTSTPAPEDPEEPKPPPCGHPGNESGAGTGGGGDGGEHPGEHPGDSVEGDHPGDGEGEDGVTPESGGCGEDGEEIEGTSE